ncbi:MAG: nucleotidyl transferase AbiEii/AbiGii toxin family protein [Thermoanaerobaculia bacterium]
MRRTASATGFREDVVEKVLYLDAILNRLARHPELQSAWVLKGGTALNLFFLDVPRLSVDIDVNYVGTADLSKMQAARPRFEAAVAACCEREGCAVRRVPQDHAGGKFRLQYSGAAGGSGSLELDLNFLLRVPLLGIEHQRPRFPPDAQAESVPILTIEEIAAGKFAALLTRRAARDAFDASQLLGVAPDLLDRPGFRFAFLVYAAGSRRDVRTIDPKGIGVSTKEIRSSLLPLLRVKEPSSLPGANELADRLNAVCGMAAERLLAWTRNEREFLDLLCDQGRVAPQLLTEDSAQQGLIRAHPLLQWKALNVRKFKALPLPGGTQE